MRKPLALGYGTEKKRRGKKSEGEGHKERPLTGKENRARKRQAGCHKAGRVENEDHVKSNEIISSDSLAYKGRPDGKKRVVKGNQKKSGPDPSSWRPLWKQDLGGKSMTRKN